VLAGENLSGGGKRPAEYCYTHRCDGAASRVDLGQRRAAHAVRRVTARPADCPVAADVKRGRRRRCDVDGGYDGRQDTDADEDSGNDVSSSQLELCRFYRLPRHVAIHIVQLWISNALYLVQSSRRVIRR